MAHVYLRRVSSLMPLVSCIAKTEFSLGLIKPRIFSLNLFTDIMFRISSLSAHHPFLNRAWIKSQIKSFGFSRKSLHLVLTC